MRSRLVKFFASKETLAFRQGAFVFHTVHFFQEVMDVSFSLNP
jgi:transcription elongation factor GreA-like protein